MRTVKCSMKSFFATIFCFLMNLIPGKKFWTMVNAGFQERVPVSLKNSEKSGQAAYETKKSSMNTKGKIVFGGLQNERRYLQEYIAYLYDYVDYLPINRYSTGEYGVKVSFGAYEDSG